jgi:ribose transport system substrate-binding protein
MLKKGCIQLGCLSVFAAAIVSGCGSSSTPAPVDANSTGVTQSSDKKLRIAFIPKGATHEFWKAMEAGARKAAEENNVELLWKSALKEDDRAEQVKVVENFTNEKVDGIVLAPLDENALTSPSKEAMNAGIPVLIVDSGLKGLDPVSFIATDNYQAGKECGEQLAKAVGAKAKVVLLRYQEGSASTMAREQGFLDAAKEKGLEVVSSEQYGGATRESAQSASENLIARFKSGDGLTIKGIFTPNESTAFGMMRALQTAQLLGKVTLVGFDSSKELLDSVKKGDIEGLMLQDPFKMGYLGVTNMVKHIKGEKLEAKVNSGSVFVTKANIESDAVKALLPKN